MVRIGNPDEATRQLYYFMWFQGGSVIRKVEEEDSVSEIAKQETLKLLAKTQAECGAFGFER